MTRADVIKNTCDNINIHSMNQDQHNIFSGYKQILNEQMAPAAPPAVDAGQAIAQAEQLMANGPGQDAAMLQQQVQAVQAAQDAINAQVEQLNLQIDRDEANAAKGNPIDMSGENPGVSVSQSQLQQLNDKMTGIMQMAQTLAGPAQQAGVDTSMLTENIKRCVGLLREHAGWYARNLIPGKDGDSLNKRMSYKQTLMENRFPELEQEDTVLAGEEEDEEDSNYLRDVLGYEPEDFEQEDPDQAAMDRMDAVEDDTVELANRDRPSAGPEDALMDDVHALERLLDDETRAVMDDEGGTMSRREARETAKDIIKHMIDRL
jgi:hypothetical protein